MDLRLLGETPTIVGPEHRIGIDDQGAGIAVQHGIDAALEMIDIDADNHRHAARSREDGDMAGRTASAQYQAAIAPVGREKHRWRHILRHDDCA